MFRNISVFLVAALASTGFASEAFAHHTDETLITAFTAGAFHAVIGFDHILALLAIGIWSSRHGARLERWMPVVFVIAMLYGLVMATAGHALPAVEIGVAVSVAILGLLLAASLTFRLPIAFFLVAVFAVFHGFAHADSFVGSEYLASTWAGLLAASIALQALGMWIGRLIQRHQLPVLARGVGFGCIATGMVLLAG